MVAHGGESAAPRCCQKKNGSASEALVVLLVVLALSPFMAMPPAAAEEPAQGGLPHEAVGAFGPMRWEPNLGQTDARVLFVGRALNAVVFLTAEALVLALPQANATQGAYEAPPMDVVRLAFAGGNASADAVGEGRLPGVAHYFLGSLEGSWVRDVPLYYQVRLGNVWPGIDLLLRGTDEGLVEYDFEVRPGGDPGAIGLSLHHHAAAELGADGSVVMGLPGGGNLTHHAPVAYQAVQGGRVNVSAAFDLAADVLRFGVGAYDPNATLTIDPVLTYQWGSYLGGNGADFIRAVATNATDDAVFVTGYTTSSNFPTQYPNQSQLAGNYDAFVTKFAPDGQSLRYSTYLGGSSTDQAHGIAVDGAGSAYVTGHTSSNDFPTANAFQSAKSGGSDIFVAKLGVGGSILLYSSYLGGSGTDEAYGIAVGNGNEAVLAGRTTSSNFPTTNALQPNRNGTGDAVVARIAMSGAGKLYATYLGGSHGGDWAWAVAVDAEGAAYVVGEAGDGFPLANASQGTNAGNLDAFVAKLPPSGGWLQYSTYLGGDSTDSARGVAVNATGYAHVVGRTLSTNFPLLGAVDSARSNYEGFLTRFTPTGQRDFSTYLGGSSDDHAYAVALDEKGHSNVVGATFSNDFPIVDAFQGTIGGDWDAFHAKINTTAQSIYTSTFLGGSADDFAHGVAASCGSSHVVGYTSSANFPVIVPYQGTKGATQDGFVSTFEIDAGSAGRDRELDGLIECREGLQGTSDTDSDSDNDGIADLSEWIGAQLDATFCGPIHCRFPAPMMKNLYIEVDFMANASHVHLLPQSVYQNLIDRFKARSVLVTIDSGAILGGGQNIQESEFSTFRGLYDNYAANSTYFASERRGVFHYSIVAHFETDRRACGRGNLSGWFSTIYEAEFDVFYSGERCVPENATREGQLQGVFMQEIGHNVIGIIEPEGDHFSATDRCHDRFADYAMYGAFVALGNDYHVNRTVQIQAELKGLVPQALGCATDSGEPHAASPAPN